jgi:pyruvate/2-oxoglutarate dehydrogenase complex dihydrolipoamide dehydrogenase (E3) component
VAVLRAALLAEGVELREGVGLAEVAPAPGGLTARLADGTQVGASHLLVAVGRAARVEGLGLEAAGLVGSARGIATNLALRAEGNRRIWVAGDIADPVGLGPRAFTHVASQHAGIIARSMLFRLPVRLDYAALPRVTYTDPELAQIGLTEAEARAAHGEVRVLRRGLGENDRLVAEDRAEGLIKLIASPRGRLLGASVVGPRAGDMAGMLGLMIGRRLPLSALAGVVLPYPTVQEAAKRAAGDFYAPKLASPLVKRLLGLLKHLP